jgi:hypothetical protein
MLSTLVGGGHYYANDTMLLCKYEGKGKGKKVKLSLCLTKHHAMKTYWRIGVIAPRIFDLGTKWR